MSKLGPPTGIVLPLSATSKSWTLTAYCLSVSHDLIACFTKAAWALGQIAMIVSSDDVDNRTSDLGSAATSSSAAKAEICVIKLFTRLIVWAA